VVRRELVGERRAVAAPRVIVDGVHSAAVDEEARVVAGGEALRRRPARQRPQRAVRPAMGAISLNDGDDFPWANTLYSAESHVPRLASSPGRYCMSSIQVP
jgi:hypothetical protein